MCRVVPLNSSARARLLCVHRLRALSLLLHHHQEQAADQPCGTHVCHTTTTRALSLSRTFVVHTRLQPEQLYQRASQALSLPADAYKLVLKGSSIARPGHEPGSSSSRPVKLSEGGECGLVGCWLAREAAESCNCSGCCPSVSRQGQEPALQQRATVGFLPMPMPCRVSASFALQLLMQNCWLPAYRLLSTWCAYPPLHAASCCLHVCRPAAGDAAAQGPK